MKESIRVFICHSNADKKIIQKLIHVIEDADMSVLWSEKINGGAEFDKEIRFFIEHSHIFMPVLTKSALKSSWVHQEIGYALGLHIIVIPVAIEEIDQKEMGMLQRFHAIRFDKETNQLSSKLSNNYMSLQATPLPAVYQKAARVQQRAKLIHEYSDKIRALDNTFDLVRQKGGLSSFHIPEIEIRDKVWKDRYLPETRSDDHKELQRAERISLQKHAEKKGCRLIINPPYAIHKRSVVAGNCRLRTLIEFLEKMRDGSVVIAIQNRPEKEQSLTMVGDWFLAESVSYKAGDGFTNTFFTHNACEINERITEFENELKKLLNQSGWTEDNSREKAIEYLYSLIRKEK